MKVFSTISGGMKRYANKKTIIPMLLLFLAILVYMERGPFGSERIKALSGGLGTLDMRFGYGTLQAYTLLEKIGGLGRALYTRLICLDFLFAAVYMIFQSLLITLLIAMAKLDPFWEKLNLLPFLSCALDFAENVLHLLVIASYPEKLAVLISVASVITAVKLAAYYSFMALIFFLGALAIRQTTLIKKQNDLRGSK
jgi:hypothetical protein